MKSPSIEPNDDLELGCFRLADNPAHALPEAEAWAARNRWPSFEDFRRRHSEGFGEKPAKPTADAITDAFHRLDFPARNDREAAAFHALFERDSMAAYFNNLREYESNKTAHDAFTGNYTPDETGYLQYLGELDPEFERFFFADYRTLPIKESDRQRHTYIIGGSGSGKSELIKRIFLHYLIRNTSTALVLIDPHGKLSEEVARWPEMANGERLVYIKPSIEGERTPVFNPFDISEEDRKSDRAIARLVEDGMDVMAELLEKEFTLPMQTFMRLALHILFRRKGSTFADIIRLTGENNGDLLEFGRTLFPSGSTLRVFMDEDLATTTLSPTRTAIRLRFMNLLSGYFFRDFLIGQSTFDLDEAIRQKKAIIFDLSNMAKSEVKMFGKLVVSHVKMFGFRQGFKKHITHVHLFLDECHNFLTPSINTILQEARKFGIHLTLAQQFIGQEMPRDLRDTVLANTAVRITGRNSADQYREFSALTGAGIEALQGLEREYGWFCFKSGNTPPTCKRIPDNRVDGRGGVSEEQWAAALDHQVARYYTARQRPGGETVGPPPKKRNKDRLSVANVSQPLSLD